MRVRGDETIRGIDTHGIAHLMHHQNLILTPGDYPQNRPKQGSSAPALPEAEISSREKRTLQTILPSKMEEANM